MLTNPWGSVQCPTPMGSISSQECLLLHTMLNSSLVRMPDIVQHVAQPNLLCSWADCIVTSGLSHAHVLLVCHNVILSHLCNMYHGEVCLPAFSVACYVMHMVPLLCIPGCGMLCMCPVAYSTFVIVSCVHAGIQATLHGEG